MVLSCIIPHQLYLQYLCEGDEEAGGVGVNGDARGGVEGGGGDGGWVWLLEDARCSLRRGIFSKTPRGRDAALAG